MKIDPFGVNKTPIEFSIELMNTLKIQSHYYGKTLSIKCVLLGTSSMTMSSLVIAD